VEFEPYSRSSLLVSRHVSGCAAAQAPTFLSIVRLKYVEIHIAEERTEAPRSVNGRRKIGFGRGKVLKRGSKDVAAMLARGACQRQFLNPDVSEGCI
jgi:hypothetical protein